ncbi:hypothetical protein EES43_22895 [Streptomyces sp. ADI96-02]|uniref:winged helix DNA-binding domain-containing protein n=1 Tax=unclassified Streptomyces TaxID=2593676 RepID=UPI000F552FC4|nr:winged helix DNA-binding domain-containing protein [Streptomyces sp. ADI96-02]RPK56947.1 hypothetical protein EES43_22895 [Streptomyces sp. ADI96-02]
MKVLDRRTLNRTLLRRQFLLQRTDLPALDVVRRLVAVQGQEPNWPYVGLWTRIADFRHSALTELLTRREVVRSTVLRRTQHILAASDFAWLRPTVQPVVGVALTHPYYAQEVEGVDPGLLAEAGRNALGGGTLTRRGLGQLLAPGFPDRDATRLAQALELLEPLVHPPPNSVWGAWGHRRETPVALAEEFTGVPMAPADPRTMVLRYLAAFGPAGVMDVQAWSGLTRLREVIAPLRPELRTYRDEHGAELFDLPDLPLADPAEPAPVRFLPAYDNAALGHRDRRRVITDEDRKRIAPRSSMGVPLFLVDGFVHGSWSLAEEGLRVEPFRELSAARHTAVREEAERVLAFTSPGGEGTVAFA